MVQLRRVARPLAFRPGDTVNVRHSIAHHPYDRSHRATMTQALHHPPAKFDGGQAVVIAKAFGAAGYDIHALAIMPDHVHVVLGHTSRDVRKAIGHLKSMATSALRERGDFTDHTPWSQHGWNVYLDSEDDLERSIRYVEDNPVKAGLRPQRLSCVKPWDAEAARRKRRG